MVKKLKEFIKEIKASKQEVIVYLDELDTYFPKKDKRRGDVLALLAMLNVKQDKEIDKITRDKLKIGIADYQETLKCIREILDSFKISTDYTVKQYSTALNKINELLKGSGI